MRTHCTVRIEIAIANPRSEADTNSGSLPVFASRTSWAVGGAVVDDTPAGGTKVDVVTEGRVVVEPDRTDVVVSSGTDDEVVVVESSGTEVVVVDVVVDVISPGWVVDVVEVVDDGSVVVVVDVGGTIWALDLSAPTNVPMPSTTVATSTGPTRRPLMSAARRTDWPCMESLYLTGPLPAIRRLARLASSLELQHDVDGGVLRLPIDAASALIDGAERVLAPLEAGLVHAVRIDLAEGSPASFLAVACAAPTIASLAARRRHRRLLQVIHSREGVTCGYQPVLEVATGEVVGFEALLRVRIGTVDVQPSDVLAAADECGRLVGVDTTARSVAVTEAAAHLGDRVLMLNVLPASMPFPEEQLAPFATEVTGLGIEPAQVVLEAPVGPIGVLRRQLGSVFAAASAVGFEVGLDNVRNARDLGAVDGVPSFVKLDRTMVRAVSSPSGARAVGEIVRECSFSGATVIAQGVESAEQLQAVRDLGIRYAQGWHLGRPGPIPAEVAAATA